MTGPNGYSFLTDEERAKIAALTHALMNVVGDYDIEEMTSIYDYCEELHDAVRHADGTDVCDRLDYRVDLVPTTKGAANTELQENQ
jgi:hypothetical protein